MGYLSRIRWPLIGVSLVAVSALSVWLRHVDFSSGFIGFSYLQIVGTLLAFTYAANALVRFRGTHDRLTLILAFGFVLSGLVEMLALFGIHGQLALGPEQSRVPLAWMVGRTLLAVVVISALIVEREVPHSREPAREMTVAFIVVGIVAYLTSAAYLGAPIAPGIHPGALLARPWDLFPGALFLAAAIGFSRRPHFTRSAFDSALGVALWLNVACHLAATQSSHNFDAAFTLAQVLKISSYGLVLGGTLVDNARLFEQVRRLAVSDSLTGLGNYRTLLTMLQAEIQRSQRTGRSFAVLLMDLDGLKQVNDRYGHLVGSRAICRLADVLRVSCRAMDTAARYGGDEFALVLREAGAETAERVGRRICERMMADMEEPHITVSVGAAIFPQDGRSLEELLDAADRALYGMKRHGGKMFELARIAACL